LIFIILSVTGAVVAGRRFLSKADVSYDTRSALLCGVYFTASLPIAASLFLLPLGLDLYRPLRYVTIFAFPLVGFTLHEISKTVSRRSRFLSKLLPSTIVIVAIAIGFFTVYRSPLIMQANYQATESEFQGVDWFFEHKNPYIRMAHTVSGIDETRFGAALYGYSWILGRKDLTWFWGDSEYFVPDHFNYTDTDKVGDFFSAERYFLLAQYDRLLYTEVWAVSDRFTESDYAGLDRDSSINKVFDNHDLEVWQINKR
jgi:hypothetical protein